MKRCVVAADDFALNEAVDDGVLALVDAGVVTATSCLTGSPRWPHAARRLDAAVRARADIGVHIDLTEFEPLARSHAALALACTARTVDRAAVRAHLSAQLQRFEDEIGAAPDYVDGHRHVHQLPVVRDVLVELLAERYCHAKPWVRISRSRADAGYKGALITWLGADALAASARAAGLATSSHLIGIYGFDSDAATYRKRLSRWLAGAEDGDVLMCHPASRIDESDEIARARVAEFEALSGPGWPACLEAHHIRPSRGVGLAAA